MKDLILTFGAWIRYLWSKWIIICIFGVIGAGLGLTYSLLKKPDYVAGLTFVLEDSKASPMMAYAGIASQFGIDLSSMSENGVFSGDNIVEFLKSRLMVEKALLTVVNKNGKSVTLADCFMDAYDLREKWNKKPRLAGVSFPANLGRDKFTLIQDSILQVFYANIVKEKLIVTKPDKKLSFILVKTQSVDEVFSKAFTENLVREATAFYVETRTKRSKFTVDQLQLKADSVERLLNQKTYSAAKSQDLNFNPARSVTSVTSELITRDKLVLSTMYGEIIKNLELSKMAMAQETPIIQIIDTPILPLEISKFGKLKGLIIGGFLGGFLIVMILLVRKFYKEIMN
ncbi:Wzz/FepE/Etk N-terminal domain-containing protein [Chitinophaga sp. NPDC101104]|uniref:Wzz/FepE/Etk N-terminal domain-containing protein n=1 Tax=Chitinophaga sp. NPDC101104 TaxID=3390561 RepID=UPI003D04F57D